MNKAEIELLLPYDLAPDEEVLWHGRPQWLSFARRAYRTDLVAVYFAAATAWNFGQALDQTGWQAAMLASGKTILAGFLAVVLLGLLAWFCSRAAFYVITTKRVVLKVGIALPIFFNLPFRTIISASARFYPDGTGDLPITLGPKDHIAYLHLWPHAKPFRMARPEPALRCIENASEVADLLSRALVAYTSGASQNSSVPVAAEAVCEDETLTYAYSAAEAA